MFSSYFQLKAALHFCFFPQAYGCIKTTQSYWKKLTLRFTLEEWLSFLNGKAQELKTET